MKNLCNEFFTRKENLEKENEYTVLRTYRKVQYKNRTGISILIASIQQLFQNYFIRYTDAKIKLRKSNRRKKTDCCWNEYSLIFLHYNISNKTKEPVEKRNSDFIGRESDWILAKWTGTRACPFVHAKGQKFSGAICFFYYELRFIRVQTGPGKRRRDFERQSKIVRASRKLIKWLLVFSRGGYEVSLVAVYCKEE